MVARITAGDATVNQLAEPYQMTLQAVYKHRRLVKAAWVVSRGGWPIAPPARLDVEVFDLMDKWIERSRRPAEERYRRLDTALAQMTDDKTTKQTQT